MNNLFVQNYMLKNITNFMSDYYLFCSRQHVSYVIVFFNVFCYVNNLAQVKEYLHNFIIFIIWLSYINFYSLFNIENNI
jgi:hypothetical protein